MNIGYLYILIPFFVHGYEVFELDFHIDINNMSVPQLKSLSILLQAIQD